MSLLLARTALPAPPAPVPTPPRFVGNGAGRLIFKNQQAAQVAPGKSRRCRRNEALLFSGAA